MPRHEPPSLPRWARVTMQQTDRASSAEDAFVEEEEPYLRTRAFCAISNRVDLAVSHAMDTYTSGLCEEISDFFDCFSSKTSSLLTSPPRKRGKRESPKTPLDELHDLLAISPQDDFYAVNEEKNFPPSILPVAMVRAPVSLLDRDQAAKCLSQGFRRRNCPAVCRLKNLGVFGNHGSLMQEMLRQCVEQEPSPQVFASLLNQTKSFSSMQALVWWAQHTVSFDSLIVLLEDVETVPLPILQDYLQCLTALRSDHGVPVNLVLLCIQDARQGLEIRASVRGMAGMKSKQFSLPPSGLFYERIWELLFIDRYHRLPVLLPASTLQCIHEAFSNHYGSAVRAALMVKQALARHFTRPASFFAITECDEVMEREWRRLAWFCLDRNARTAVVGSEHKSARGSNIKQWLESVEKCRREMWVILRLLHHVHKGQRSIPEWMGAMLSSEIPKSNVSGVLWKGLSRTELLQLLSRCQQEFRSLENESNGKSEERQLFDQCIDGEAKDCTSEPMCLQEISVPLYELIVVVDKGYQNSEGVNYERELGYMLDDWVRAVFRRGAAVIAELDKESNPLSCSLISPEEDAKTEIDSMVPEVRRSVAETLMDPPSSRLGDVPLSSIPGEMFGLIRDRIDIPRDEWFRLLHQKFNREKSLEEVWSMFAFGIYELLHCGIIREKRARTGQIYEKAALVWCSGVEY